MKFYAVISGLVTCHPKVKGFFSGSLTSEHREVALSPRQIEKRFNEEMKTNGHVIAFDNSKDAQKYYQKRKEHSHCGNIKSPEQPPILVTIEVTDTQFALETVNQQLFDDTYEVLKLNNSVKYKLINAEYTSHQNEHHIAFKS